MVPPQQKHASAQKECGREERTALIASVSVGLLSFFSVELVTLFFQTAV